MNIRKMERKDYDKVLDMMTEFYASPALLHHSPRNVLEKDIEACLSDSPYIEGFVAECDGSLAGYMMASVGYSTEYGGLSVMIEDLYISKDFRKRGIGGALIRYAEKSFSGKAVVMRLEVERDNASAIHVYEREGFSEARYKQMIKYL